MREIASSNIAAIDHVLEVVGIKDLIDGHQGGKPAQNGGARCHLSNTSTMVCEVRWRHIAERCSTRSFFLVVRGCLGLPICKPRSAHAEVGDSDTVQAYFKPCYGNTGSSETYFSEIASFHVDRIVGFFRTPVVVPRFIDSELFMRLAEDHDVRGHLAISMRRQSLFKC